MVVFGKERDEPENFIFQEVDQKYLQVTTGLGLGLVKSVLSVVKG